MPGPTICLHCGAEYVDGRCPHETQPSDSERLDWLADNHAAILGDEFFGQDLHEHAAFNTTDFADSDIVSYRRGLRDAIDAAMEAERQ